MAAVISVVAPIFNEADGLEELRRRLVAALQACGEAFEVIFVDDGSTDSTASTLARFHADDPRLKALLLSRNFGQQPALSAGVRHASGQAVILIDADLQDPPELIGQLVTAWKTGAQVVLGQRRSRPERGLRGLGFRLIYPILRFLSDLPPAADAGTFCLMDRAVVDHFNRLEERNRFIPGLRTFLGFTTATIPYDRQPRQGGRPRQSARRLLRYAADALFGFSYRPLRLATWLGFLVSIAAFVLAVFYFITFFAFHKTAGSGFTTTIICLLFLGGVQLVCIGILGEYVARIYEEVKQRPLYVVREKIGV